MKTAAHPSRTTSRDASTPAAATPRVRRRVRNPLFGSPFVRTKAPLFPGAPPVRKTRLARNPLIVSPSFGSPQYDEEDRLLGETPNPTAWETAVMRSLETFAGSLGGFGWNFLAGTTVRSMNIESPLANDVLGYVAAAAPALAFATLFRGDETWKAAMAGASLYDVWATLAHKMGVGQLEPAPPSSP